MAALICAVPLFYLSGFSGSNHHHAVLATVLTCGYLAFMAAGMGLIYYAWKSAVLKEHGRASAS